MKKRARPRRSTDKRGAAKVNPRRLRAAARREIERVAAAADDIFNQP